MTSLYIDLLIRALTGELNDRCALRKFQITQAIKQSEDSGVTFSREFCSELLRLVNEEFESSLKPLGETVESYLEMPVEELFRYLNWMDPLDSPHTMCPRVRLENVRWAVEQVLEQGVPGDLIETGVWKGGVTVLMRGLLAAHGDRERKVWVADSFQGLPRPDPDTSLKDAIFWSLMRPLNHLTISLEYVQSTFDAYGLLDQQTQFLKGWFCDTLPTAPIQQVAVMRMDGDLYESTRDALESLYPKLSPGGFVIVDDYGLPCGCRQAVDDYRQAHDITEPLEKIDDQSVYWRRSKS